MTESPRWFKSSYSTNGGECIEAAANLVAVVPVRDSKDPGGPVLTFSAEAWAAFIADVKSDRFPV